jgi:hypothetical protein
MNNTNNATQLHNPETIARATAGRRAALEARKLAGLSRYKTPIETLADDPSNLRKAINAMCFDCQGCGRDPNVQREIAKCSIQSCPLYAVRPYQQLNTVAQ